MSDLTSTISKFMHRNGSTILSCGAIFCGGAAIVAAIDGTVKVMSEGYTRPEKVKPEEKTPEYRKEVFEYNKKIAKAYTPCIFFGLSSMALIVSANTVNLKRTSSAMAACALSQEAFKEYKDKAIDILGKKKDQEIKEAIVDDKMKNTPEPTNQQVIVMDNDSETLFFDEFSSRYFKSTNEALQKLENEMNKELLSNVYYDLNDYFYEVGLETMPMAEGLGWNYNVNGFVELSKYPKITESGKPCIAIVFSTLPIANYEDWY